MWFLFRRLNKYILYAEGLSKGRQATQSVKWNEIYKWKVDMKYPVYEPELVCAKANVDHTISDQRTAISTFNHLATTPRANTPVLALIGVLVNSDWLI